METLGNQVYQNLLLKCKSSCNVILFHREDEKPYGCFSNWYLCSFVTEGILYSSSEQYMMVKKTLLFEDLKQYEIIMNTRSPAACQKAGKNISHFNQKKWDKYKGEIVMHAVSAKFSQNADLNGVLLSTGDDMIAEAAKNDIV